MTAITQDFDLARLRLSAGEGRRLALDVPIDQLVLGGETYDAEPALVPVMLDVSRMVGNGYAMRLRFTARVHGACMRCLDDASPEVEVDAREVDRPGGGDELSSPYVRGEVLDVAAWARDSFVLAMPTQVLCRPDCAGLCQICAANLNDAGPEHGHDAQPDPRWAKLRELRLEG